MTIEMRFGKKLPVPSTKDIKHDLRLMAAADALAASASDKERALIIGDLACKHGLSPERAGMLVDRFGIGRAGLDSAAQNLLERRA